MRRKMKINQVQHLQFWHFGNSTEIERTGSLIATGQNYIEN